MRYEDYVKLPGVRWSRLKEMRVSPLAYRYTSQVKEGVDDAEHFRIGRALHAFLFEPELFREIYVCYIGRRQGRVWDDFQDKHAHQTILSEAEWGRAIGAGEALLAHPIASQYLADGFSEHVVQWQDEETGIACKARVDHCNGQVVELKSTSSIERRLFAGQVARYCYHGQVAWYLDGLVAAGHDVGSEPILIAVESLPPFDCVPYRVEDQVVELGRREYRKLLEQLVECQAADRWPGIARDQVVPLVLPEWAYGSAEDELVLTKDGERVAF